MPSSKNKIKYIHWDVLEKEDYDWLFEQALKKLPGYDAIVDFFKKNKSYLKAISNDVQASSEGETS